MVCVGVCVYLFIQFTLNTYILFQYIIMYHTLLLYKIYYKINNTFIFTPQTHPHTTETNKMGYEDFVHFCLAEEDKTTESSLRYWFSLVDIDGDGVLSHWELAHFYKEQLRRMKSLNTEEVAFEDILCQLQHLMGDPPEFTLTHFLHKSRIHRSGLLFNMLFNLNKFQAYEQNRASTCWQETIWI